MIFSVMNYESHRWHPLHALSLTNLLRSFLLVFALNLLKEVSFLSFNNLALSFSRFLLVLLSLFTDANCCGRKAKLFKFSVPLDLAL